MTTDIRSIVTNAAQRYGLEPETMLAIAQVESVMGTKLDNPTSSAGGIFQFIDKTWKYYGNGRSKYDHEANADAGMRLARNNSRYLKKKLGRDITAGEYYLAHQQGAGGAYKILRQPDANAVTSLGDKKVRLNVPSSMRKDGSYKHLTNAQFARLWSGKIDKAKAQLGIEVSTPIQQNASQGSQEVPSEIGYGDVTPIKTLSHKERRRLQEGDDTTVLEGVTSALRAEWSVAQINPFGGPDDAPDPDWVLDLNDRDKHLTKGIPPEYWDRLGEAHSGKHAERISEGLREELEREAKISSMGPVAGPALRIAAAMTDPGAWAVTAAMVGTGNVFGAGAMAAKRFGRAGTIALGALEGAASNTLVDSALISGQYTREADELLFSMGTGLVMGGAFGALSKTPMFQEEALAIEALGRQMQEEAADNVIGNARSTVGAARAPSRKDLRTDTDTDRRATQLSAPEKPFGDIAGKTRYDISAGMKDSKNPLEREIGNHIVEDGARNAGDAVTPIGTSEYQSLLYRTVETNWRRAFDTNFRAYAKREGIGWFQKRAEKLKFSREVYRYVTDRKPVDDRYGPEVMKVGNAFRKMMDEWRELANNPGAFKGQDLPGLREDFLEANPHYAPRIPNQTAIRELTDEFGQDNLGELVAAAVKDWNPDIDPAIASRIGKGYITKMHKLTAGQEIGASRIFNGEDLDQLKEVLEEFELGTEEIAQTLKVLEQRKKGGERSRMKSRLTFDEQFKAKVKNKHGQVREVSMSDLFVQDADFLMQIYSRHMSGDIALANLRIKNSLYGNGSDASEYLVDGIRKQADWDALLERVRSVGESVGQSGDSLRRLNHVYKAIRGTPNFDETSTFAQSLRLLRDYNFVRVMGQVGFAQMPEMANIAGQVGWKTMLTSIPAMRSFVRNARTGKLDDALAREIEETIGFGTDALRMNTIFRNDDAAFGSHAAFSNKWLQKIDNVLFESKKVVANASMMTPVNTLLQRWAGKAMFNKFAQMAEGTSKINIKRMKGLGLDEEMMERVFSQIRSHARYESVQGRKLKQLDVASWDDLEAASAFQQAVYRWGRSAVQEDDIGQFAAWMSHPLARTVLQFRSFLLASWSKQFLQGLNYRDMEAFTSFTGTVFAGGLVYTAQTHLNAIGRDDREEWLEKRLEPKRLITSAFQRSSWFSLLAPGIDAVHFALSGENLFDGRTTGLSTGFFGNPTVDLLDTVLGGALGEIVDAGDGISQQGAGSIKRALPVHNLMGITQMFNLMVSDLPEYESRDH